MLVARKETPQGLYRNALCYASQVVCVCVFVCVCECDLMEAGVSVDGG